MNKKIVLSFSTLFITCSMVAQNVGIGTNTPAYKFDVIGNTRFTGHHIQTSAHPGGTWNYLINTSGTPTGWKLITGGTLNETNAGSFMLYNDQNEPHFILRQAGNIGIGTMEPISRLHVVSTGIRPATFESPVGDGTWVELTNTSPGGSVWSLVSTGQSSGEAAGNLLFHASGYGAVATMDRNGNMGIGTSNPSQKLSINGNIEVQGGRFYYLDRYFSMNLFAHSNGEPNGVCILPYANNTGALGAPGIWWGNGYIGSIYYNQLFFISDQRTKMNIRPLESVLDKIQRLQPIRYDINPATHPSYKNARPEELEQAKGTMGFTAQNIQEVFPSMVIYNKELGVYTIRNYDQLLSVLVQAMKEQQSIINKLDERIKALEEK
jgi:hypothetical protein